MAKGALYWRLKDEKTGKWTYKKAIVADHVYDIDQHDVEQEYWYIPLPKEEE